MTRRVLIVGTGTGVGKTWVGCMLARAAASRGARVVGLKPVESGVAAPLAPGSDAAALAAAAGFRPGPPPYGLLGAISPHLAARRSGTRIELEQILIYVQDNESIAGEPAALCLIESAGGLFTPLGHGLTNFDLVATLEPEWLVLVAPDALGVLHDVTATLGLARALGRDPDVVVLSAGRTPDESTGTNAEELVELGIAKSVFRVERDAKETLTPLVDALLSP